MKIDSVVIDVLHDICMNSDELDLYQAFADVILRCEAPEKFVMKLEAECNLYLSED